METIQEVKTKKTLNNRGKETSWFTQVDYVAQAYLFVGV